MGSKYSYAASYKCIGILDPCFDRSYLEVHGTGTVPVSLEGPYAVGIRLGFGLVVG